MRVVVRQGFYCTIVNCNYFIIITFVLVAWYEVRQLPVVKLHFRMHIFYLSISVLCPSSGHGRSHTYYDYIGHYILEYDIIRTENYNTKALLRTI